MKSTVKLSALLLVMIALFSCDSMDVMKRRYTGGFYVHHSGGKNTNDNKPAKPEDKPAVTQKKETDKAGYTAEQTVNVKNDATAVEDVTTGTESKTAEQKETTEKEKVVVSKSRFMTYSREEAHQLKYSADGAEDAVMLLILILLAIFLPPLAVYLKQDGIDKWFWVTLILCLLSIIGIGFTYLYGLWFIAFVIALLVVLDILD
jgi:uncharacterized membrane protein YqaE (UPF0057 family)